MDFTSLGALQQRPGSQTFLTGPAMMATFFYEAYSYTGNTFIIGGGGETTWYSQTGASFIGGQISSIYEFQNLRGQSYVVFSSPGIFNYGASLSIGVVTLSQLYYTTGATFGYLLDPATKVITGADNPVNKNWSFANFLNRLFFANGDHFYKWDGNNLGVLNLFPTPAGTNLYVMDPAAWYQQGITWGQFTRFLPYQNTYVSGSSVLSMNSFAYKYCLPAGTSLYASIVSLTTGTGNFTSMTYTYSYGFINERGFRGPVSSPITISGITTAAKTLLFGFSNTNASGFTIPEGYGIGCSFLTTYQGASTFRYPLAVVYRDNGPGTGRYLVTQLMGRIADPLFLPMTDNGFTLSNIPEPTCISATLPPRFLEVYNNQLFMTGFSQAPSTVQFSDLAEPESVQPESNFDVRTNDGDWITGMKAAFSQLFIFKNRSFHSLQGDSPDNFALSPLSDQYGCISNRAIATYKNYMLFLDKKGIAVYTGAQIEIISQKLDPIFANMNLPAAADNAWMIHNKQRNQVWCGIPVNGSTQINQVIVYDYLLNAWTHFDGLNIACATPGYGDQNVQTVYFGGYSSYLGRFGASLTSDFGNAITMMWKTRFMSEMGQSVEKMWRRLFINQISSVGATISWNLSYYSNYSTSVGCTNSMAGLTYQIRSDFGISAKSLSVQGYASTSSDILGFLGFTIEHRFQRNQ